MLLGGVYSVRAFRVMFAAGLLVIALCVAMIIFCASLSTSGSANLIMEGTDRGSGTIDNDIQTKNQMARMMAQDSTGIEMIYSKTTIKAEDGSISDKLKAEMSLDKGDGSRRTKFVVTGKGDDASSNIFIDQIMGAFEGSAETWIDTADDGSKSFDMTFTFEGRNITYHGQFYNREGNRVTDYEGIRGIGNLSVTRHYNKTSTPHTEAGWLDFCAGLNRDVILDKSTNGVYIAPEGWYADKNGILWREADSSVGYYMDEKGTMKTVQNSTI
jgi:hypothetical protein